MAKTGGAVQKLRDKSNQKATALRMGTIKPIITRTTTPYAEKMVAYLEHQRAIHGHVVRGVTVREGGRNPCAVDDYAMVSPGFTKTGKPLKPKLVRVHSGIPDEVIRGSKNWSHKPNPKTMAERAEEDTRKPLKSEWRDGYVVGRNPFKPHDVVSAALSQLRATPR